MKSKIMINLSSWEEERGKLRSEGKCEGMNSHSQGNFHFGSWSFVRLPNLLIVITRVKIQWIEDFFIPLESPWNVDV
jgi:hypothetical protein